MGDRCTGHCCRDFTVPLTREQLVEYRRRAAAGEPLVRDGEKNWSDIETIVDMLVHVRTHATAPDGSPLHAPVSRYTCRHLQPNGDCGIYERRPQMCRKYPYGGECQYRTCTWSLVARSTRKPDVPTRAGATDAV